MSLEAALTLVCDGCGTRQAVRRENRFGELLNCARSLRYVSERDNGWQTVARGPYRPEAHYCPRCQDKPIKPVPRDIRPPWCTRPFYYQGKRLA